MRAAQAWLNDGSRSLAAVALALACGQALATEVRYVLWDSLQMPAYRQCAADFTRRNPQITIKINQAGWGDYWTSVSMGLISGAAPDVITNHLAKHPDFVNNGLLVDLAPYIQRDKLDLSLYPQALVEVWGRDGKQYGLPKDWDTISLMVNLEKAEKAGVSPAELQLMHWNPKDGGSFEHIIRRLTLDSQGRNALHPDFDRSKVAVYGYQTSASGGMAGQVEWSHFAVSNGFRFQDKPWAVPYRYDDPRLAETIAWLASLPGKGLSAPFQNASGLGADAMFVAGKVAMVVEGSWMISYFSSNAKFRNAWAPLPIGPTGQRATMINGLSDAMWVGSKVKEEAWQWIKYLASPDCQRVVASRGATFPAVHGMAETVVDMLGKKGIDASAFLAMKQAQTFQMPIADNGAQVEALMKNAIESVLLGKQAAGPALTQANEQIKQVFRKRRGAK